MAENKMLDIKKYLNTPENPLSTDEFMEWWHSLTDEEIAEYKAMELK